VVDRLEAEHPNLRAALGWLAGTNQAEAHLRLVAALGWFWYLADHLQEGRKWLEQALAAAPAAPASDRAHALWRLGHIAHCLGDAETAESQLERGAALARRIGATHDEAHALLVLGIAAEDRGDYARAEPLLLTAKELLDRDGAPKGDVLTAVYHLGVVAYGRGELERAVGLWRDVLMAGRAFGDPLTVTWCLNYLGLVACEQGDLQRAAETLGEALSRTLTGAMRHHWTQVLWTLAVLASATGENSAGAALMGASEAAAEGHGWNLPERVAYERAQQRLHMGLGDEAFAVAWKHGSRMLTDEVVATAEDVLTAARRRGVEPADQDSRRGRLTIRELDVLRLLVAGKSNPEIAVALFISPRTASTHVSNIFAKLDVTSRTEAATWAVRQGLV
jgi:non-specific serine/threonine protein kinase